TINTRHPQGGNSMTRSLFISMTAALCLAALTASPARSDDGWGTNYQCPSGVGCYPHLNSALYPCPKPDVPYEVGRTVITNQDPHQHAMLSCHRYRAIYPPYYYQSKCGLACLPFFPKPCIKGTVVTVKYKSKLPCGVYPPSGALKTCFSNSQFR